MPAATDEAFESHLDDELGWRRIELQALRIELEKSASSAKESPVTRALARSMSTMIYAHWEGFCKSALDRYVQTIVRRKPRAVDLNDGLLVSHARQVLKRMDSGDVSAKSDLLELVRDQRGRIRLVRSAAADTQSNLRFAVLENLLGNLGISSIDFETKRHLIDVLMCDRRNAVAHGRDMFPDPVEVLALHRDVIELMETMQGLLISSLRSKAYLT